MDIDDVFRNIGELGYQQKLYTAALCTLNIYAAMHMLQYAFVSFPVDFICTSIKNQTKQNGCFDGTRSSCARLVFDTSSSSSIVSEWGLVCDDNWRSKATMSGFMSGVMIGALILGKLSDRIGRKSTMTLTTIGIVLFNAVSAFATSYGLYVMAKFCVGFFCAGNILSMFVLGNELVGPSKRGIVGVTMQAFFSLGIMGFAYIAYLVQHWRQLTLLISLIGLPFAAYHFFLPESPRWLLTKNRSSEALKVLEGIARGNGKVMPEKLNMSPQKSVSPTPTIEEGVLDLFRSPELAVSTCIQIYSWFVNSASYYGLTLAAGSAGGGLYTTTALSGAVEIPAYVLTNFLLSYWGRRKTLCAFMVFGGVACLIIQILGGVMPFVATSCALMGKLCLAASFAVVYIHSGELFPTTIRNSAMGIVSVAARFGGICAPFIVLLGDTLPNAQFTVFGLLAVTAGLANLKLPETLGKALPESISDMMVGNVNKPPSPRRNGKSKISETVVLLNDSDIEDI